MSAPRQFPYIYVTWLSKLLAGENQCEWAVWFQAHNSITKRPSNFDTTAYQLAHTALLREIRDDLKDQGYTIFFESQNYFELIGKTAKLAGKPDIIALRGDEALVVDGKTGEPRVSHSAQVMLYMWALPKALPKYKHLKFTGMVIYKDALATTKTIKPKDVTSEFVGNLAALIQRVAANKPPERTPSQAECGFCAITDEDCDERVDEGRKPDDAPPETDAF